MEKITLGTKENLIVDVTDRLGSLTALAGTSPTFDVIRDNDEAIMQQNVSANTIGMTAHCLVDTTVGAWEPGVHKLYLKFESLPEIPRLGPLKFVVER